MSVKIIARNIIKYSNSINAPISNLKLQKLLYFTWIEYYKRTQRYLFNEEFFAWQFGPVVPQVYNEYCAYGGLPIIQFDIFTYKDDIELCVEKLIEEVVEKYKDCSAFELVNITHKPGHAWDLAYRNGHGYRSRIPYEEIIRLECVN